MYKQNDNNVYVLVQIYPWFDFIFFCFGYGDVWLTHYHSHNHTPKQKKIKIKPRIKLNHNMYKLRVVILQKNDPFHACIMVEFKCLFFWTSSLSHPFLLEMFKLLFYLRKIVIFQENVTKMLQKKAIIVQASLAACRRSIGNPYLLNR